MEWETCFRIHRTFGGNMQVGSLVKWVRDDQDCGDLGVVFSVTKEDGTCEVYWVDGQFLTYGKYQQDNFLKVVKF